MHTDTIRTPRTAHARLVVVGLILALSVLLLPGRAFADPAGDAGTAVALVNQTRAGSGLPRLWPDRDLQIIANAQANRMAESGSLFHSNLGGLLGGGWWMAGENVGAASSVYSVHNSFMNSSYHAANILDWSFNHVGVGVAYGSDGNVYVAQVFGAW